MTRSGCELFGKVVEELLDRRVPADETLRSSLLQFRSSARPWPGRIVAVDGRIYNLLWAECQAAPEFEPVRTLMKERAARLGKESFLVRWGWLPIGILMFTRNADGLWLAAGYFVAVFAYEFLRIRRVKKRLGQS